ncbi:MAG: NAD(P)-dependent oxidoreductase [Gemmatimonadetes bacterium]|nr:NAD(P)-dependent oxidoreductase [Gemmatimonadota bacterium]
MLPRPNSKAVNRKERLDLPGSGPPRRPPADRLAGFGESWAAVSLEWAQAAARRCIQCPAEPCVRACPLGNDIPFALWHLEHGLVDDAALIFRRTSSMPDICGRVCPQTELCEGVCPYAKQGRPPVPIGRLEAYAADWVSREGLSVRATAARPTGRRIAIVGAGPAGITAAELLAGSGHAVTLFDAWPEAGGLLLYGIPRFKLSPEIVRRKTQHLSRLGIRCQFDTKLGNGLSVDGLVDHGFDAILLAIGAGIGRPLDVPGSDLEGVYQATPFLVRTNTDPASLPPGLRARPEVGRRVAVIGGGDTAMDCVRTALRLGSDEATVWYRRTEAEMPGNPRDRKLAIEEGSRFEWLAAPVGLEADENGQVRAMRLVRMQLGEADASGRRRPIPIPGSEHTVEADTVVLALGYLPDADFVARIAGLDTEPDGRIRVDPLTGATSRPGIFAAGDNVLGPALVVDAVAHGLRAAEAIDSFVSAGGTVATR